MTQTKMCLLYLTTDTISRCGFTEVGEAQVKLQKSRYEWKVKQRRKGESSTEGRRHSGHVVWHEVKKGVCWQKGLKQISNGNRLVERKT